MNIELQFTSLKNEQRKKKKKLPRKIFDIFIIVFILINSLGLYIGNILYKQTFEINTREELDQMEKYKNTFNEVRYNSLEKESISIASRNNYRLYGTFIKNGKETKNTVIILHGLSGSRWTAMKYADMYLDKGFNVFVYDGRNHGYSKGNNTTYGFFESDDLDKIIDFIYKKNNGGIIGVHGEDIGGVAALLQAKKNEDKKIVSFYVVDSAFSDLNEYFTLKFKNKYNLKYKFLIKPFIFYLDEINRIKNGFYLNEVSPINILKEIKTPIMFIHGSNDSVVPKSMAEDMYNVKENNKKIYIVPNSEHGETYFTDEDEYTQKVNEFIDSVLLKSN
ncbi:hypothetical protein SAMN05428976_12012 [Clostridium sp. USBA 49]|uniref:alpha/beta hydrolase n=1 Tax=Clostridium TaxID=1485 RepID=UPI0009CE38BB|nr:MULTISPECIES: alpha/beta hydrolase [Clostridium]SKA92427.1 hypothetical protein SAMN05428976_12012 [Clostridium sp. USBA 49]